MAIGIRFRIRRPPGCVHLHYVRNHCPAEGNGISPARHGHEQYKPLFHLAFMALHP